MKHKLQGQFSNPVTSQIGWEDITDSYRKNSDKRISEKADHTQEHNFLGEYYVIHNIILRQSTLVHVSWIKNSATFGWHTVKQRSKLEFKKHEIWQVDKIILFHTIFSWTKNDVKICNIQQKIEEKIHYCPKMTCVEESSSRQ
jgi:hypothetical protein